MRALFSKEARRLIEPAWVADTQRRIQAMGCWPKKFAAINFEVQGGTQ